MSKDEGQLRLVFADPNWVPEFEQTRSCLLDAADGWISQVEHIGSTAIPGATSRPIIDCLAGLDDLNGMRKTAFLITGINFRTIPLSTWIVGEPVIELIKPRAGQGTHHVWLVERSGDIWNQFLQIRDYFKSNPLEVERLAKTKKHLANQQAAGNGNYADGMSAFYSALVSQLRADLQS